MSPPVARALRQLPQLELGRVRVHALFSTPLVLAQVPEDEAPRLVIDEGITTVELRFLCLDDLIAFQHNLAHLTIPRGVRR